MFLSHFGFQKDPFGTNSDNDLFFVTEYLSKKLNQIQKVIGKKSGVGVITGAEGVGKSAFSAYLANYLKLQNRFYPIHTSIAGHTSLYFYKQLAESLSFGKSTESKGAFLVQLRALLNRLYAQDADLVIVIDDAQRLSPELLETLKLLLNTDVNQRKMISIILVGGDVIYDHLRRKKFKEIAKKNLFKFELKPLNPKQTQEYINHRIRTSGAKNNIFDKKAIKRIYQYSEGFPSVINQICRHALIKGFSQNLGKISDQMIRQSITSLKNIEASSAEVAQFDGKHEIKMPESSDDPERRSGGKFRAFAFSMLMVVFVAAVFYTYFSDKKIGKPYKLEQELISKKHLDALANIKDKYSTDLKYDNYAGQTFLIYFDSNSNEFIASSKKTLDEIASILMQAPEMNVVIRGYTDSIGDYNYNLSVSKFRANTVKSYLIGKGCQPSRIETYAMGQQNPIASNRTEEGRSKNRRVEIQIQLEQQGQPSTN